MSKLQTDEALNEDSPNSDTAGEIDEHNIVDSENLKIARINYNKNTKNLQKNQRTKTVEFLLKTVSDISLGEFEYKIYIYCGLVALAVVKIINIVIVAGFGLYWFFEKNFTASFCLLCLKGLLSLICVRLTKAFGYLDVEFILHCLGIWICAGFYFGWHNSFYWLFYWNWIGILFDTVLYSCLIYTYLL